MATPGKFKLTHYRYLRRLRLGFCSRFGDFGRRRFLACSGVGGRFGALFALFGLLFVCHNLLGMALARLRP
jgi:hypothetical protein